MARAQKKGRPAAHAHGGIHIDRRTLLACLATATLAACDRAGLRDAAADRVTAAALARAILPDFSDQDAAMVWRLAQESLSAPDRDLIHAGLSGLDAACQELFAASYPRLVLAERVRVAALLDAATFDALDEREEIAAPRRFFELFKALAVVSYFTSEAASERRVRYDPVPGAFTPDVVVDAAFRNDLFDRGSVYLLPPMRWRRS